MAGAGAVAFVFGLCALSFAGGCVLTAFMLRRPEPVPDSEPGSDDDRESRPGHAGPAHRSPVLHVPESARGRSPEGTVPVQEPPEGSSAARPYGRVARRDGS
ncbi:hypothetical protein GCM10022243_49780 [Saccharothrix violaceirubra]|uniref:Uncharacterized protein n=1 Tax=Saccharothrix violaceirubra TaxID=413306 RepID=A0A7W7WUR1_9PSEU|nr:hypothetical protein [Saccharothrix violaceirubra]MBB4963678.1 hypothetical protein [Saccharothrix violaceirubra]